MNNFSAPVVVSMKSPGIELLVKLSLSLPFAKEEIVAYISLLSTTIKISLASLSRSAVMTGLFRNEAPCSKIAITLFPVTVICFKSSSFPIPMKIKGVSIWPSVEADPM